VVLQALVRRLGQLVIVLFGVTTLLFVLLRLSGDPAVTLAGPSATPETLAAIREDLGLNESPLSQYLTLLGNMGTLQFGDSLQIEVPALSLVLRQLPYTLGLSAAAIGVTALTAIPLGLFLAVRRDSRAARALLVGVVTAQGVPGFVTGMILIIVFAVLLGWFPVFGASSPTSIVLPAITLAAYLAPKTTRVVRAAALETLGQPFVKVGRAKGLAPRYLKRHYVLSSSIATAATVLTLQFAQLLGGAIVVETIFAWPGVGSLMVQSVLNNDFPIVEASVFVVAILVVLVNFLFDITLPRLDPRLREASL